MSGVPVRRFKRLSIGDSGDRGDTMPITRAGAKRHEHSPPAEPNPSEEEGSTEEGEEVEEEEVSEEDEEEEEEGEEDEEEEPSRPWQSPLSILYDISGLSQVSQSRVKAGMKGSFGVEQCSRKPDGDIEIQVRDTNQDIRLGELGATCSCSEFSGGKACQHIFWFIDSIFSTVLSAPERRRLISLRDNGSAGARQINHQIDVEKIARDKGWAYVSGDAARESSSGGLIMSRLDIIRDIFSIFEEKTLPKDFRRDLFERISAERRQELSSYFEPNDLQGTIIRLAIRDSHVYSSLESAVPANARAQSVFGKHVEWREDTFRNLDNYARHGPRYPVMEVRDAAARLRQHVLDIRDDMKLRAPPSYSHAAQPVVTLLERIVLHRNKDVFAESNWGRTEPPGEQFHDRNLFHHLMERTPEFGNAVLEILEEIPRDILTPFRDQLDRVRDKLRLTSSTASYATRLGHLLRRQETMAEEGTGETRQGPAPSEGRRRGGRGGQSTPSTAGQKRPVTGDEKGGKRRHR